MKEKMNKITINRSNGISECYVLNADYRELEEKYYNLLASIEALKPEKELKKYDEIEISGNTYFVLKIDEEKHEVTYCMKNVLSREEMLKYFTDPWYQDSSDYCVRYNSDIRNNKFEDSYIYKVLNSTFKEDKLKNLGVVGDVRLLTKEEVEVLDEEHRNINKWYWTMTPYNDMKNLEDGSYAYVFYVYSYGYLRGNSVNGTSSVRPVFTLKTDKLL